MKTQVQIKDCLNLLLLSLGPKSKKNIWKGITHNGKNMFERENSSKQALPYLLMQMYFVLLFLPISMCTAALVSTLPPSVFVRATQN